MTPKQTWWLSPRTDGKAGKGTRLDPFDCSGDLFDKLMREKLGSYSRFHLVPWQGNDKALIKTTGSKSYNEALGFYLPSFVQIVGSGIDRVTIQKISHPETGGNAHGVFEMGTSEEGSVSIEGLTIDQGGQTLVGKATSTFAARLWGNNCTLKNIHETNGYGHRSSGSEAFCLSLGPNFVNGKWQECVGGLMSGLVSTHFMGDYGYSIVSTPGADQTGSLKTLIKDCTVTGHIGTAPYGMGSNVRFENCQAVGCHGGWYCEAAGNCSDIEIVNCKIASPISGYGMHFNPLDKGIVRHVLIQGNRIEISNMGISLSGSPGLGHQFDFTIRKNHFLKASTSPSLPGIVACNTNGLIVEDNLSDPSLWFSLNDPQYPSLRILCRRNGCLPPPKGLEDLIT